MACRLRNLAQSSMQQVYAMMGIYNYYLDRKHTNLAKP